jgi:L-ascorbate metabolism protein UlaG (beta-lactamase superfamily)
VLFDPGNLSHGFEGLTGLDGVIITHGHPDHADVTRIPDLVELNPGAVLLSDPSTAGHLAGVDGAGAWTAMRPGDTAQIGSVTVRGMGGMHATIHPELPTIDNTVFILGDQSHPAALMHPGDSLFTPPEDVDVLAIPAVAPWMKIWETVDYLRAVAPRVAVPIHQAIASEAGAGIYHSRLSEMRDQATTFTVLRHETETEV